MPGESSIERRDVIKGIAGISAAALAFTGDAGPSRAPSLIKDENAKPGDPDWQLTYTKVDPATRYRSPWIEGYASRTSVRAGESIDLFVSANPAGPFRVDIYRMGYYGGAGARRMAALGPIGGKTQPDPPIGPLRRRECAWERSVRLPIPSDWPSGVYLGKLSLETSRWQSYVVFIVRDDRPADLLFQCSDNTWQAYNRWPSQFSLYDDGKKEWALVAGVEISRDRPYGKYCQILDAPLSQGSGEFLLWEFPLCYWLEKHGYDVTYASNVDVHADPARLANVKGFLSVGHDEYWSLEQYAHVRAAIDAGMSAAFLSGNTCCFVTPLTASGTGQPHRVLTRAGRYGGVSAAEKSYMGPFPVDGPNEALLIGARTISPFNGADDWRVSDASHWLFAGTGMRNGDGIPGLVGWEFHGDPAPIPGLTVVAKGTASNAGGQPANWTSTIYPGPKGNWVFNASTIYWAQGLSHPPGHQLPYSHFGRPHGPDPRVERITKNLLARMIGG